MARPLFAISFHTYLKVSSFNPPTKRKASREQQAPITSAVQEQEQQTKIMASAAAAEAPMCWQDSPQGLSADWVFSNNSNVHICNDRRWFTEFTPFQSVASNRYFPGDIAVEGVGVVNLPVKRDPNQRGPQAHHVLRLTDVLYTPSSGFNILGSPLYELAPQISMNPTTKSNGSLADKNGNRIAFFSPNSPLFCLRLSGPPVGPRLAPTNFDPKTAYILTVVWPDSERARWNARDQPVDTETKPRQWAGEQPYTAEEKAWLKKHYQGEYKFLRSHGLSIYDDEDREEGRAIVRAMMSADEDEEEEDEEEEDDDDDDDDFAHVADYLFDEEELAWIKKHYKNSATFMFSYGLKFYDEEDYAEGRAIVRAMMSADEDDDENKGGTEDEEEEDDDDDDDDDETAHFADYHFNDGELAWIQKHYKNSATFMFSYGLKFYDDEDCAEATGLVRAFMIDGE
ncbi:uncharacterized protein Triagg1_9103 [Trichoderma aggressivum f. europaeum]|uniref:Retrovirus-related Pol polyprotein from transposon TNT 1-94-like beta-barrel domain-containing protein n=1 Tax=Trichoderma aggressivum f. europaeum TaxID=173218 RepID=A0AAE1J2K1_9HYPO|nr:hypothetical protein Triagg1_9103 [Trichoderma aggressivum f. europaeum]